MDSLDLLDKSLDDLEEVLAPLLGKSLSETVSQLDLLQKAKLQTLLPYVVNDLVFIYLRTRGINPKTHPVVGELDRVKQYFDKIKKAEDPEKRRFAVDQGAATRFIKHAIKESQAVQEQAQRETKHGTHTRFTEAEVVIPSHSAAALAKIQAREAASGRDEGSSDDNELEVFDQSADRTFAEVRPAKGKGESNEKEPMVLSTSKKRRRAMDPWTGYDERKADNSAGEALLDEQQHKKAKRSSSPLAAEDGNTPAVEVGSVETHAEVQVDEEEQIATRATTVSKTKKGTAMGVIDVDALSSESSGGHASDPRRTNTSQVIDIDAIDSSRSGTPVQGKKKKKKKKSVP